MRCHITMCKQKEAFSDELAQVFTLLLFTLTELHQAYSNVGQADWGWPGPLIGGNLAGRAWAGLGKALGAVQGRQGIIFNVYRPAPPIL